MNSFFFLLVTEADNRWYQLMNPAVVAAAGAPDYHRSFARGR